MCDFFGMLVPRGQLRPEAASYAFGLNSRYQIDPTHPQLEATMPGCSLARAMNHSCMPNVCSALASNHPLPPLTQRNWPTMHRSLFPAFFISSEQRYALLHGNSCPESRCPLEQTVALKTSFRKLGFSVFEASHLRQPILIEPGEDEIDDADELVFMAANQFIPAGSEVILCWSAWVDVWQSRAFT